MENAQSEPSMEEILASIRRIISEDDDDAAPASSKPTPAVAPQPQAAPKAAVSQPSEPAPTSNRPPSQEPKSAPLLTPFETEDVEMIRKNVAEAIERDSDETILDETSAAAASEAFQNLSQTVRVSGGEGNTLEDIVVQMLKPMIKEWLNENLPSIVQETVEEEVQRVARRRR